MFPDNSGELQRDDGVITFEITPEHEIAKDIEIFYKGEKLDCVTNLKCIYADTFHMKGATKRLFKEHKKEILNKIGEMDG